jgi:hypothetical protein
LFNQFFRRNYKIKFQSGFEGSKGLYHPLDGARNAKGGCITVPLTSCLTDKDWSVLQIKTKIVSCHTADFKSVKQEVNGTVILPPLVFPGWCYQSQPYNGEVIASKMPVPATAAVLKAGLYLP